MFDVVLPNQETPLKTTLYNSSLCMPAQVKKATRKAKKVASEVQGNVARGLGFSEQVRVNKDGSFVTIVPRAPPGEIGILG